MNATISAIRGEWVKLVSLRSTWVCLGLTVVLSVGLGYLIGMAYGGYVADGMVDGFDPLFASSMTLTFGLLALVAFAILATAGEYNARTIQTSLLAVPQRGRLYLAKTVAAVGFIVMTAVVATVGTFFVAQYGLGETGVGLDAPDAVRTVIGSISYLTLMAVFAFGVGAMLRSSTVALAILMPILFLSSQGLGNLPAIQDYAQYLPDQGGQVIMHIVPEDDPRFAKSYGAWTGLGITALWAVAAWIGGWFVTRRTEA